MFSMEEINSTKNAIKELLNKHPKLNENGWAERSYYNRTKEEYEKEKQFVVDKADVFLKVCECLMKLKK